MLYNLKNHEGAYIFHELRETKSGTFATVQFIGAGSLPFGVDPQDLTPYEGQPIKCENKISALAQIAAITYKLDPARILKAAEIMTAENPTMIHPRGDHFQVTASNKITFYTVSNKSCECQDHKRGHICKHRIAAWMYKEMHPAPDGIRYFENTYCFSCNRRHWLEITRWGEACHGETFDPYTIPNSHTSGKGAGRGIKVVSHV